MRQGKTCVDDQQRETKRQSRFCCSTSMVRRIKNIKESNEIDSDWRKDTR